LQGMTSVSWQGAILGIQPRIRLTRSFDERAHTYLGYATAPSAGRAVSSWWASARAHKPSMASGPATS
jgi:hypothetical protein